VKKYQINYNLLTPFLISALLFLCDRISTDEFPRCTWSYAGSKNIKSKAEITYDMEMINSNKISFFEKSPRSTAITTYDLNSNPITQEVYLNGSQKIHQKTIFNYSNDVLISKDIEMLYSKKKSKITYEYSNNLVISSEKKGSLTTTIYSHYDKCRLVKSEILTSFGNESPDTLTLIPTFEKDNNRPNRMYILSQEKKDTILFKYSENDENGEWQNLVKTFKSTNTKEAIIRQFRYY